MSEEKEEDKKVTLEDVFESMWGSRTVEDLLTWSSTAGKFRTVYEYMADQLRSAIGGPDSSGGPIDPDIGTAVLLQLEVQIAEIDEVVSTASAIGLSLPSVQDVLAKRKETLEKQTKERVDRFRELCKKSGVDPDTGKPLPPEPVEKPAE